MFRFKAALKHFIFSVLIFSIIIFVLIMIWYPSPYFMAAGGWQGLQIAAPIDLVLGPLLTLVVFDKAKSRKKLIGDMAVIVILQLSALGWGVSTIYQQRPIANVYWGWEKSFFSVSAADLQEHNYDISKLYRYSENKPALVIATRPDTASEAKSIQDKINLYSIPPYLQTELYGRLENNFDEIRTAKVELKSFIQSQDKVSRIYSELIAEYGGVKQDYLFIPLYAKYQDLALVFKIDNTYVKTIVLRDKK